MFRRNIIDQLQADAVIDRQNDTYMYKSADSGTVASGNGTVLQNGDHGTKYSLWIIYYLMIMMVGTVGNSIVAYILVSRPFMKEKYIFSTSICAAHILFCAFVLPISIAFVGTNEALLQTPCHVIVCFLLGVTSYSMLTQAVRRFMALSERFRFANFTYKGKKINTVLIWAVSVVLPLPLVVSDDWNMYDVLLRDSRADVISVEKNPHYTGNNVTSTTSSYTSTPLSNNMTSPLAKMEQEHIQYHWLWVYSIVLLCVQIVLPCTASLVLHSLTLRGILKRPNQRHWVKEIQITKQHIIMQIILLICWVPLLTTNLAHEYSIHNLDIMRKAFQLLAPSIVVYNPVLYYFINAHIRREMEVWFANVTACFRTTTTDV